MNGGYSAPVGGEKSPHPAALASVAQSLRAAVSESNTQQEREIAQRIGAKGGDEAPFGKDSCSSDSDGERLSQRQRGTRVVDRHVIGIGAREAAAKVACANQRIEVWT